MASILSEKEPQPLARYAKEVPAELERIVSKALRKDRDERYQTIKDLLLDLKSLKRELEFADRIESTTASTSGERATEIDSGPAAIDTTREEPARSTVSFQHVLSGIKQHKRTVTMSLAVLVFVLASFSYWFFTHSLSKAKAIQSIAVLPFVNASGNSDLLH